jgi:hypothetical protein
MPLVLIREEPGVHLIGLDCANYLSAPITAFGTSATEAVYGKPFSQQRENIVLKMRCLQGLTDTKAIETGGTSFDFTAKGGDLNTFYTNNCNDILLNIAHNAISADGQD